MGEGITHCDDRLLAILLVDTSTDVVGTSPLIAAAVVVVIETGRVSGGAGVNTRQELRWRSDRRNRVQKKEKEASEDIGFMHFVLYWACKMAQRESFASVVNRLNVLRASQTGGELLIIKVLMTFLYLYNNTWIDDVSHPLCHLHLMVKQLASQGWSCLVKPPRLARIFAQRRWFRRSNVHYDGMIC